jgi:predicted transposase YbfD/YdcC
MKCNTAIAKKIRDNEGDYILQVKGNQKTLLENLKDSFAIKKLWEQM